MDLQLLPPAAAAGADGGRRAAGALAGPDDGLRWLYVHGSHTTGDVIIPQGDVDRLFALFREQGRPHAGALKAGFRGINDPDSPLRSASPPK